MRMRQAGFSLLPVIILLGISQGIFQFFLPKPSPTSAPLVTPQLTRTAPDESMQQKKLEKYLIAETALLGVSDNISLYFKDLDHGKEIAMDPTRSWIPASTIKTFVVLEAFRQRSLGLIDFDQVITIKAENVVPTELETDEFPRLREGATATIRQLVEAMVIQSDNTAYNTLLDILDRRNINLALKNIGITQTVVGEKLNLDADQFQKDLTVAGRQPNTTTVKDLSTFFDLLYNKKIGDADEILAIFKRQKINNMIPALLPQETVVAHKTGDWAPIYHDGGVIFKPEDPFILAVFTNSDNPQIIAQLARVAYFQNAESVGKVISFGSAPIPQDRPIIQLAQLSVVSNVLAAETAEKFPEVSAADLGITQKDLNISPQKAKDFFEAIVTPGPLIYKLKRYIEEVRFNTAKDNSTKVKAYLDLSKNRLAEAKTLIGRGDFKSSDAVLKESENNLEQATKLAEQDPNKELLLVLVKQVNDLHYAVFANRAEHLNVSQKEQFIDNVYNFYQQNHQKVTPVINSSVIASPTQQKPAIGTITEINNNQARIQFDDGSSKQIILTPDTKVRAFQQQTQQSISNLNTGDKVAVVGLSDSKSQIIPQFILKNIPQELPQRHQGTIIEIKPSENTIKILDQKGQQQVIKVDFNTVIKSKDTNVSLEGIKTGSQITVFGNNIPSVAQPTILPSLLPSPSVMPSATLAPVKPTPAAHPSSQPTPVQQLTPVQQPPISVHATSITVTQNSSGKQDKVESKPKKETPKKESKPKEKHK